MNFEGHLKGAVVAGAGAVALAVVTGYAPLDGDDLNALIAAPLDSHPFWLLGGIFASAGFMALFPDLDTASIPQRWFLRMMFVLLVLAHLAGRDDLFAVLAFAALLPLLHKHRGWTHWKLTPWLVAVFLAVVYEVFRARAAWFGGFSWQNVGGFLAEYWMFVLAAVMGHYTHLLLDRRSVRWLPFVRNPPNHH